MSSLDTESVDWHWKSLKRGSRTTPPKDALTPACEVYYQLSPSNPAIYPDYDITQVIDWWYVVKYQAVIPKPIPDSVLATSAPLGSNGPDWDLITLLALFVLILAIESL